MTARILALALALLAPTMALGSESASGPAAPSGSGTAPAGFLPPGDPRAAGARHIVLIYNGQGHRRWQQDDFTPLLARVGLDGKPLAPLFDTFLVLPLALDDGSAFCPGFGEKPLTAPSAAAYRDGRLFGGDDQLRKLDRAAAKVADALHAPSMRWKVILTLPYPDRKQTQFGAVEDGGNSLDFSRPDDRLAAMRWYIRTARERWNAAGYSHLDLVGWYWVQEGTDALDEALTRQVAPLVHADGGRFFWIPWFKAPGFNRADASGFDATIHQPNYFFNDDPETRLYTAADLSRKYHLGVEMELDELVLRHPEARAKYRAYMRVGRETGFRDHALTAWYMGVDALGECARSKDPDARAIYDETCRFIAGQD